MTDKNLYPVNNAIEAKKQFDKATTELNEIKKDGEGGNTYTVRTDASGFNTDSMYRGMVVEVVNSWFSDMDREMVFTVRFWGEA